MPSHPLTAAGPPWLALRPVGRPVHRRPEAHPLVAYLAMTALLTAGTVATDAMIPRDATFPLLLPGYAVALLWIASLRSRGRRLRDPDLLAAAVTIVLLPGVTLGLLGSEHPQPVRGLLWLVQALVTWALATYRLPRGTPLQPTHIGRLLTAAVLGRLAVVPITPSALEAIGGHDLQQFTITQVRGASTSFVFLTVWLALSIRGRADVPRAPMASTVVLWGSTIIGYGLGGSLPTFVFLLLPFSVWAGATCTRVGLAAHTALVTLLSTALFLASSPDDVTAGFQHMMMGHLWSVAVVLVGFSLLRQRELTHRALTMLSTRQRELVAQSRMIEAMHASISDGFVLIGADRRLLRVNAAGRRLTRRLPGGTAGLADESVNPDSAGVLAAVLDGADKAQCDLVVPATGATLELRAFAGVHGGRRVAATILRDVTDERAMSQTLRDFARIAAHDLRGPLTSMSVTVELASALLDGPTPGLAQVREAKELLTRVVDRVDRAETMIVRLLEHCVDDDGALHPQVTRVSELIECSRAMLADEGLEVRRSGDAEVVVDPRVFQRVIDNILGNAVKYRRPDTPPVVDVRVGRAREGQVDVTIDDNGIGLREGAEERIFTPRYRDPWLRPETPGSGLGLAFARQIVERHHGSLHAERLARGTRMRLQIPGSDGRGRPRAAIATGAAGPHGAVGRRS